MSLYKKILVCLELNDDTDKHLLKKARAFAEEEGAKLFLVHAVEHLSSYGAAYGISAGIDVEEVLLDEAKKSMAKIGKKLELPDNQLIVKVGPAKFLILEEAEHRKMDLIIIGSHGRHGIRILLGSTANAILHSAKCDVLAVRVYD
jgi:universal stress protein A